MKKLYLALVTAFVLVMTPIATVQARILIHNNYGATIKYKIIRPSGKEEAEKPINNGEEVTICSDLTCLSGVSHPTTAHNPDAISDIQIRTTGKGSGYGLSPYTSLKNDLIDIVTDLPKMKIRNRGAIIHIDPSSYLSPWNIRLEFIR